MSAEVQRNGVDFEEWGDGRTVAHWGDDPGKWVMYDPESDTVDLDDWC